MAKKQATINENAAAAPARAARPRTPRIKAAQHSKAVPVEMEHASAENPHDAIARIAYSLWEARGNESGSAVEDWLLAEQQYREARP